MTRSSPLVETVSFEPLGGFRWGRADTLAVIGIAVVLVLAYYPMTLQGKIPLDRDTLTYFYPLLSCFDQPRVTSWNPYQLGGCSLLANPQAALFYPPNWIFFVLPTDIGLILSTVGHYYLAALGIYLLARFSRLSVSAALVAAFAFCLGGYMTSRLMLRPLLLSAAWFPWVFLCYLYAHYRGVFLGYLLAGVFLALQVLTGMPHNAVYSAMALGFFLLYKILREAPYGRRYRVWGTRLAGYILFMAIGLLLAAVMILPTLELLPHTVRTWFQFEEATSGSLPWKWLPGIFTGGSFHQARVDWEFNETNCYIGAIAIWLALFALVGHWQKGIFWFYIGLVFLSILFALGSHTPFFALFYKFPYLESLGVPTLGRFFDIPSRFLGLTAFALAMLAAYGMEVLGHMASRTGSDRLTRMAKTILVLLSAGCLIWSVILADLAFRLGSKLLPLVAEPAATSDAAKYYVYANFGFFTLVFGLFTIAFLLGHLRKKAFQALLVFVLVADLVHSGSQVGLSYGRAADFFRPPVVVRFLQERADPTLRVMGFDALKTTGGDIKYTRLRSILMPKLGLLYRVPDVSGYDPLILRRYSRVVQDMVGLAPGELALRVVAWRSPESPLLDLLRVGYVIGEVHERLVLGSKMELRPGERRVLRLQGERPCHEIRIRSVLTKGIAIRQDTQVGEVILRDASGSEQLFPIRAGRETADVAAERAHFHHPAQAFQTWSLNVLGEKTRVHNYVCRLPLPRPMRPVELELRNASDAIWAVLAVGLTEAPAGQFQPVLVPGNQDDRLYRNTSALPQAWWVHRAHVEPSARRLLRLMEQGRLPDSSAIDYQKVALLEKPPAHGIAPSRTPEGGQVKVLEWKPGRIALEVESDAPGVLVLSEMKYPGWKATVNGKPAEILTANYILRALSLPAGSHRVEMVYRPRSFSFGLGASVLTAVLVALLFLRYRRLFPVREYRADSANQSKPDEP